MTKSTGTHSVTLFHKKSRYQVLLNSVPAKQHILRIWLQEASTPLILQVNKVVYEIAANGRINKAEIHLSKPRRPLSQTNDLVSRFHTELNWRSGDCPPCIWDCVRMPQLEDEQSLDLRVLNIIHEIHQNRKKHTIKIQVIDASPKRVFSEEDIQAAFSHDIEPLNLFGEDVQRN